MKETVGWAILFSTVFIVYVLSAVSFAMYIAEKEKSKFLLLLVFLPLVIFALYLIYS